MVKEGQAVCRFLAPNLKYEKECQALEKKAIDQKLGCKWGNFQKELFSDSKTQLKKDEIVQACKAKNYIGQRKYVEGFVVAVTRSKKNNIFLNFERPYPNQCFSAVIFASSLHRFPKDPEILYLKKKVRVFGEIKEYKGKPEIILESQNQIEILE